MIPTRCWSAGKPRKHRRRQTIPGRFALAYTDPPLAGTRRAAPFKGGTTERSEMDRLSSSIPRSTGPPVLSTRTPILNPGREL